MLPKTRNTKSATKPGALVRAARRFRQETEATHIGVVIDATGSRAAVWEEAQRVQARMFRRLGGGSRLSLRLVHFGGGEITDHGWADSARRVARNMAAVRCRAGLTQVIPALMQFTAAPDAETARAIILIGDSFEEESRSAERAGAALKAAGIKVFSFLEGEDMAAGDAFARLAAMTGGRFARFGDELPLAALCEGVALLSAGRSDELKCIRNKAVRRLFAPPR